MKKSIQNAARCPFVVLNTRQINDIELLLSGGFAPLTQFMGKADYESVLKNMRLSNGTLFPIPITLDIPQKLADILSLGDTLSLRDEEMFNLAILTIEEMWEPNLQEEALAVYATDDPSHPGVDYLLNESKTIYVSGTLQAISPIQHADFTKLRHTPEQTKKIFKAQGWERIVAFQTRNPMHRAHFEMTQHAMRQCDAKLLLHPTVGTTRAQDIDYFIRTRCYQRIMKYYPKDSALLSLLPLAMRFAGPREALWHGIIRKNHGCTHFIVGRDHASPGLSKNNTPFYSVTEAQELFAKHQNEIGIQLVPFETISYSPKKQTYVFTEKDTTDDQLFISGTQLRKMLADNEPIPEWFSFPEIVEELKRTCLPLFQRGFALFFTGLSGSGKSTLARALVARLMEIGRINISILDGDIVRQHLSSELGFSKEHRSLNVRRIGYVANEIVKSNGIAICAQIAPYAQDREVNRRLISKNGAYIEIYVDTPLSTCEERDTKGLYLQARENITHQFTGITDPYEAPKQPDITLDTSTCSLTASIDMILQKLLEYGYLKPDEL